MKEIRILEARNETHENINKNQEKIIQDNLEYNTRLKLSNGSKDKSLGSVNQKSRKNYSTTPLSKAVSNVFKFIYFEIESFSRKSKFLSDYNKFWVLQNVDHVIKNINVISREKLIN